MFRLRIKNFQIIKRADMTFKPGLNVIVGPTNNGKSAIFRAIEAAIFNKSTDNVITSGERAAAVGVEYNGHSVIWQRDSGRKDFKVTYMIDGQTLTKVGRGLLDEVESALGISEIELLRSKEKINFIKQMSYPFLLDRTPAQLFEFLSLSAEEENLNQILNIMKQDSRSMSESMQVLNGAVDVIKINKFKEKDRYERGKEFISSGEYDWIIKEADRLGKVEDAEKLLNRVKGDRDSIEQMTWKMEKLQRLTEELGEVVKGAGGIKDRLEKNEESYERVLQIAQDVEREERKCQGLADWVHGIGESGLEDLLTSIKELEKNLDIKEKSLRNLWYINEDIVRCEGLYTECDKIIKETVESLKEFKVCPLCGSDISEKFTERCDF